LSVAFAGFAGLASVFRDRADQSDIKVDAGRLTNMLTTSLSTTMLSLIPLVPDAFRVSEMTVWRISGLVAVLPFIVLVPGAVMRTKRMARYEGFSLRANVLNFGLTGIAAAAFTCSALGLPAVNPGASYLCGLIVLMLVMSILFFRVIVSLLRPHAPD
jgi:hypothetical protein